MQHITFPLIRSAQFLQSMRHVDNHAQNVTRDLAEKQDLALLAGFNILKTWRIV